MFNKKLDRFAIRKLTVGAASVLIGVSFLSLNDTNKVQAADKGQENETSQDAQKQEPVVKQHVQQLKVATPAAQSENNNQTTADTNEKAAEQKQDDKVQDPNALHKINVTVWDDVNGKNIEYTRGEKINGEFDKKQGDILPDFSQPLAGYRLLNNDDLAKNFTIGKDGKYHAKGEDVNLTLHYAPLSNVYAKFVDEDSGKVLSSFVLSNSTSTVKGKDFDASKYESHAIDIPGYKLVSEPYVEGKLDGQVQSKNDPNYINVVFKYKKITKNADMVVPGSANLGDEGADRGAQIVSNWNALPGMFGYIGTAGKPLDNDNGDIEKKTKDLIDKYINQGYSYLGTTGKLYNKDNYNYMSTGTQLYLVPNRDVSVNYLDKDGNKLADSDTIAFNHDNPDQTNNGINTKKYWHAKGTWTASPKDIKGYHVVKTEGATTGNFTAFNYVVNFIYDKDAPKKEEETKSFTRTINYVFEDGKTAAESVKQPVILTRTKTTDPITDKVTYTDWTTDDYQEVKSPELKGYTVDTPVVEKQNATKDEVVTVTYKKNAPKKETESKQVTRTINYVFEDGKTAAKSVKQPVTLTRINSIDAVTDEVTYGTWTTDSYAEVESPELKGYTVDIPVVEKQAATKDEVVTVTYKKNAPKKETESKQVTRTINYVFEDGKTAAKSVKQPVILTRINSIDAVIDEVTYGTWTTDSYAEVESPELKGYTVDTPVVEKQAATKDEVVTVTYKKNAPKKETESKTVTRTINYVYEDGKTAAKSVKQPVTLTRTKATDPVTDKVTYTDWTTDDYAEVKSPELKGYTVDTPVVEKQNATKDETVTVTYKKNAPKKETETKQITRTINYVFEDGKEAAESVKQPVTLTRTNSIDAVTDEVTHGAWTTGDYAEVKSPELKGYTVDTPVVEKQNATKDEVVTVTYKKNAPVAPETPVVPDQTPDTTPVPEPQPETPAEPEYPTLPEENEDVPAPHGEDIPTDPAQDEPVQPETTDETVAPHGEDVPTAEKQEFVSAQPQAQQVANHVSTPESKSETVAPHASELPQTGSENETASVIAGLALVGLTGTTLMGTRRRRNR